MTNKDRRDNSIFYLMTSPLGLLLLSSVISAFWLAQFIVAAAAYFIIWRLVGKERAYVAVWVGTILLWWSTIITYNISHVNDPLTLQSIVAVSGFPLMALHYPVPPMGADIPPWQMWPAFNFNYAFWIIVAAVASKPLIAFFSKKIDNRQPLMFALPLIGLLFMVVGLLHILIRFD